MNTEHSTDRGVIGGPGVGRYGDVGVGGGLGGGLRSEYGAQYTWRGDRGPRGW